MSFTVIFDTEVLTLFLPHHCEWSATFCTAYYND